MRRSYLYGLTLVLFFVQAALTPPAGAAPRADLWEKWAAHDETDSRSIDHAQWDRFLKKYVKSHSSGVNRVAYAQVSTSDRADLEAYINNLAATPISGHNRDEQLAYWINLYNALTVKLILDHYPVQSIRDIKPGLFSFGPWKMKLVTIEEEQLTLDNIEHRILRPIWKDPRIHYAVNCASIGCPNLQPTAFTAATTPAMLDRAAEEFINHPRGFTVNGDRLVVSSIYKWFEEDFGDGDDGVIQHLRQYASTSRAGSLAKVKKISDDRYDWSLNDTAAPKTAERKRHGGTGRAF